MINRRLSIILYLCSFLLCLYFGLPLLSFAQGSLSLSVTPTLFDISVEPGQTWRSSVRIINPNAFDMTVYVKPVHFSASGERGISAFQPVLETESQGATLAEWFEVSPEPVVIPMQQALAVPFVVTVPDDASPGGQYAALLVSTQPFASDTDSSQIRTTQAVSSLFFMRVEGEVIERGMIRSFRAIDRIVSTPRNEFSLRFQNDGTVHLQPQGTITIFNMWGQKRGEIPVNQRARFGLVLPKSEDNEDNIREYRFSWEAVFSLLDIGRYRAEAVLAYGQDQRRSVQATTYFWVIPVTGLLIVLGTVLFLVLVSILLIRRYVRRMLLLAGVDPNTLSNHKTSRSGDVDLSRTKPAWLNVKNAARPLIEAKQDIKERLRTKGEWRTIGVSLLRDYWLVLVGLGLVVLAVFSWTIFTAAVYTPERAFEVTLEDLHQTEVISSEELALQAIQQGVQPTAINVINAALKDIQATNSVAVINVSGESGVGAALAFELATTPLTLQQVRADLQRVSNRTVIVVAPSQTELAQQLSRVLNNALVSPAAEGTDLVADVVIYVGADIIAN